MGTGLSFQTLNSSVGDILTSTSSEINLSSTVRFGTLTGNADFDTGTGVYNTFSEFDAAFTSAIAGTLTEGTPNNVSATIAADTLSSGVNLWLLVEDGAEQGVFYLGATPSLGQLDSNPQAIALGTGGADIAIGSSSGNNILLQAVPEPSAFALLAGCFGLAAVMVRRRR